MTATTLFVVPRSIPIILPIALTPELLPAFRLGPPALVQERATETLNLCGFGYPEAV
jgi:hypothetical protein